MKDLRWNALVPSAGFIAKGLGVSIVLSVISIAAGLLIAVPVAAARVYGNVFVRSIATVFIEAVRCTPELMVLFWIYFGIPRLTGDPIDGWIAAIVAMTLIAAAYLAEVVRAGFFSVAKGQWEAGRSTGISDLMVFIKIILPQALRNMIGALLSQMVMLFKTTSLVYIVGVIEFFRAMQIVNNAVYAPFATYALLAVVYFVCCGLITKIAALFERY
jgi:polar amino acid transport system permease protein